MSGLYHDEESGLVFGWGIVSKDHGTDYFDRNGLNLSERSLVSASLDWMQRCEAERRYAMLEHRKVIGSVPMVFPLSTAICKALGIATVRTGLLVAMQADQAMVAKAASGDFAYSYGVRVHAAHAEET